MMIKCSWFATALYLANVSFVLAQERPVMLSIESQASTILPYEPLPLRLVLRNATQQVVETTIGLRRLGVETTLLIAYQGDNYFEWKRGWLADLRASLLRKEKLIPGQVVTFSLEFFWQEAFPAFAKTGKYRVKAKWRGSMGVIESEPLAITVIDGTENDKACLKQLLNHRIQGYLSLESKAFLPKPRQERLAIIQGLYEVVQQYGDSRYAVYSLSTLLNVLNSEQVEPDFRNRILATAKAQIQQNPQPRVLYFYAKLVAAENPKLAQQYLNEAKSLKPDLIIAEMILRAEKEFRSGDRQ